MPSISRISTASDGTQGNGYNSLVDLSTDGRYALFYSDATNLTSPDPGPFTDLFVKDTLTGAVSAAGTRASQGAISADGRYVVFTSADPHIASDTNSANDVYLRDLQTGAVTCLTMGASGSQIPVGGSAAAFSENGRYITFVRESSFHPNSRDIIRYDTQTSTAQTVYIGNSMQFSQTAVSDDGRYVFWEHRAPAGFGYFGGNVWRMDLMSGFVDWSSHVSSSDQYATPRYGSAWDISADGRQVIFNYQNYLDVYLQDIDAGTLTYLTVTIEGKTYRAIPSMSADGRFVAYMSTEWIADNTQARQIYLRDMLTGAMVLVSQSDAGNAGNNWSGEGVPNAIVSGDGSSISFASHATNLVSGDSNGKVDVFLSRVTAADTGMFLTGTAAGETLTGDAGNDALSGLGGGDVLQGLAGLDTLIGGAGDDVIDGGDNTDTVSYAGVTTGVTVDLNAGMVFGGPEVGTDTLISIERVIGTEAGDVIGAADGSVVATFEGRGGDDQLFANDGDDMLDGGAGNDSIVAGAGNDYLVGGSGNDTIDGGAGNDTLSFAGATTGMTLVMGSINATTGQVFAGDPIGMDTFSNIENVVAGEAADTIGCDGAINVVYGMGGNDTIFGWTGADVLEGGAGDDLLFGQQDDDTLRGGDGADRLYGWAGNDQLWGGGGADAFVSTGDGEGLDVIRDYSFSGGDVIDAPGSGAGYTYGQFGTDVLVLDNNGQPIFRLPFYTLSPSNDVVIV